MPYFKAEIIIETTKFSFFDNLISMKVKRYTLELNLMENSM